MKLIFDFFFSDCCCCCNFNNFTWNRRAMCKVTITMHRTAMNSHSFTSTRWLLDIWQFGTSEQWTLAHNHSKCDNNLNLFCNCLMWVRGTVCFVLFARRIRHDRCAILLTIHNRLVQTEAIASVSITSSPLHTSAKQMPIEVRFFLRYVCAIFQLFAVLIIWLRIVKTTSWGEKKNAIVWLTLNLFEI